MGAQDQTGQAVTKCFISSSYRADPLGPAGSFTYEVPGTSVQTFEDTVCCVQDVHVPHVIWTVNLHAYRLS